MAAALNLTAVAAFSLLIVTASAGYTNHTVGGDSGWFFNATANTSTANFSSWAATQTFNLGDYLSKLLDYFGIHPLTIYLGNANLVLDSAI